MFDGPNPFPETLPCGAYALDLRRRVLRDAEGAPIVLRPKSFELLRIMIGQLGRAMTRAELLCAAWPGVHVTDDSLTQCISEIRRALGADAGVALRTIPKHGYVLEAAAPPVSARRGRPRLRVIVQLLDGRSSGPVWSDMVEGDLRDLGSLARGLTLGVVAQKGAARPMRRVGQAAHSPARIRGSARPSASSPSTSTSAEPIIQSTWMRLRLPPRATKSSSPSVSPSRKHFL